MSSQGKKTKFDETISKCDSTVGFNMAQEFIAQLPPGPNYDEENAVVYENLEVFQCLICWDDIPPLAGVILSECFHFFCRSCISDTIQNSEGIKVKCPYNENGITCDSHLTDMYIKDILTKEQLEKFLKRSLNQAEQSAKDAFHCKTPNCNAWWLVEQNFQENFFQCPICKRQNCLKCKAIHEAVPCSTYQRQLQQEEMDAKTKKWIQKKIGRGEAMKCPTCNVVLEKTYGCDAIKCKICKTELCWATKGPRWGPKGVGDTSGGCHCGEGGRLCHRNCRGCH